MQKQFIPRRKDRQSAPLSFAQRRLWFLNQLEPESSAYNTAIALRLEGDLNLGALSRALDAIVERHEVLRTTYVVEESSDPIQRIDRPQVVEVPTVDLSDSPQSELDGRVQRMVAELTERPFELSRDLMLRARLLRLAVDQHVLVVVIHHIASDGWSAGILWRELAAYYTAFSQGKSVSLPELAIQYADYAVWQREWLSGEVLANQLDYWKKQQQDLPTLQLPTDRPRPAVQSYRGAQQAFKLSEELIQGLKKLSRDEGVTLFMTLLAAFQTLLSRYSGQEDICVGSPIANRKYVEIEGLIGFFVNTLVLRSDLSGKPTFRELLSKVKRTALQSYAHQDLPFEKLVEELQPERNLGVSPLFQVMFALQNYPRNDFAFPGLAVSPIELHQNTAKFDLSLALTDTTDGFEGRLEYSTDLFDPTTVARMIFHFQTLLEGIVANPDQRINELPLLTEAEKRQLLVQWNDTKRDYPLDKCIHQLFEEQVERSPDSIALVFEDRRVTYRELNIKANQLAHHLRKQGVGPDVLVAICMERSVEMVVGLLGILKAGGAYVPLDPTYPSERLEFLLKDAAIRVLIGQERLIAGFDLDGIQAVCIDRDWGLIAEESDESPAANGRAEQLAYVIYTSGSTGKPKGVAVPHRGLVNLATWHQRVYGVTVSDRATQLANPAFDASIWEIWPYLISGASLWIPDEETRLIPEKLVEWLADQKITLSFLPTPLAEAVIRLPGLERLSLRALLTGGDRLHPLPNSSFSFKLVNHYGPTEASVVTTFASVEGELHGKIAPPIGRPIGNTQVYILDSNMNPAPIGVVGELHIGGDGLARGYLDRPELTKEKFIVNPFSTDPTSRLYKTGDLARYLPDGNIEFLGRIDNQVKIRGYRIELGEIEAVLGQHPAIREAVVLAREDSPGDGRLVAYVVAPPETSTNELRSFLKQKLPEFMVPSAFVFMDALPLTPNGKVDRRALPAPDPSRPELDETFSLPRTPTEELLANIWAEVLKLDKVGIHDNFFDLGGHSLLATQLISRIRDSFRFELPLRSLFEAPTVAGLAEQIGSAREEEARIRALPILPEPIDEEYPLSFSQERFWFLEQLEPNNSAFKVAHGFHLVGPLKTEALEQTLSEIVHRHEILRTTFHLSNDKPVQRISDPGGFRLSIVDLRQKPAVDLDAEVRGLFENEHRTPFDLSTDVLLRATLVRLSTDENVLLLGVHHIAWDHWSIELFFRELSVLYQAFAAAKPSPLFGLPIQYKHYALWQRKILQGAEFDNYLAYWKEQLDDAPASLNLPVDHPRQPLHNRRGDRQVLVLPKELSSALGSLSKEASVTLFMTYLAAFQTLLHRITGEDDIVVGTPVAGRDRSETEGLIGLFLNSLALRTNLSGNPTFLELLARVREVALGAYNHQEIPFEKLVAELQPERDLSRTPIFQVFINMYNFKEASLALNGLAVRPLTGLGDAAPQFDLEFYIREHDDGIHLIFGYDSDLFDSATINRMAGHFQTLLEGIVVNPEQRISELPLLTDAEERKLLIEWNDTKSDYPKDKCIHELFEEQVEKTPDAIALVFEDQQLTYRELDERSNQLAHYLSKRGVRSESLVGVCLERSAEMIIALLGVLKAGAAYLPLDPSFPKERLGFMLQDSQVSLVLSQERASKKISQHGTSVVYLDRGASELSKESTKLPRNNALADSLAYVLYTSGSTGNPKGVAVEHRQLANYLFSIVDRLDLTGLKSFATVSTIAADLGNTVIFPSLCSGGALHVISQDRVADGEAMADYFNRHAIDCLKIVPSHLAALQAVGHPERVLPRRLLILGGESSNVEWVKSLGALAPDCRIVNHYGPTETTVGVTTYAVKQSSLPVGMTHLPLGRPIANTEVYILDKRLKPVPIGIPGELHVGGDGLARGYMNRPELTAEKFIPNPFSTERGARLYTTGDLARYLPDGNIEFLGRTDNQIKIRGYRIELGEIETALRQHPEVRDAVVLGRSGNNSETELAAYVAVSADRAPTVAGKRRYQLPNGTAVAQINKNETDYIYQEIFERQAYLRHGITISDGDCIFDVGANIGLFTVFVHQIANKPTVFSFEPNPTVFELLAANTSLYGSGGKLFSCGLSDAAKTSTFTFFPGFSLLSGFYADVQTEKQVVKTFMINQQRAGVSDMAGLVDQADAILAERFQAKELSVELRTLSSVIEEEDIETIDLLKINVEKSELDVLNGIADQDWQKIKQIVVEVDVQDHLPAITSMFDKRGYEFVVEQDSLLEGTSLCYVYAIRPSMERRLVREQGDGTPIRTLPVLNKPLISTAELRDFLTEKLPEYMVPSALVFLDALPLTPNGKVDRQALRALNQDRTDLQENFVAPRTPMEELLAQIWSEVLKLDRVGVHDNFFDLGGHSLLAVRVVSRIREVFLHEIPLRALFEAPTVAGITERIELTRLGEANIKSLRIVAEEGGKDFPLSFSQERFWFLDQLEPNNSAYKVAFGFRLTGALKVEALEESLAEIVRRHETLRTTFHLNHGTPVQVISQQWSFRLTILDVRQETLGDVDVEILRLFENEARRPFDLSADLLLRATLLRLSDSEHVFLINSHHIAWDHWSTELFFRELSALYHAFTARKPALLPDLPIQYKHYAQWQRKIFQGAELEHHAAWWKRQLSGAPSSLNLPTDHPRKPLQNRRGDRQTLLLPNGVVVGLRSLSRNAGVTFFMTLLGAFQTLLYKLTGDEDIVVGTPVAGRDRSETEGLVGLFLNSLALRTRLSGNPTFRELLTKVRDVSLGAYEHQDLPFEKLVEELQPERDLSRTPVYQAFINLYNFKEASLEFDGLSVNRLRATHPVPQFDLEFYIREHDDGVHLTFVYDSDLFEFATIQRMLSQFQTLLESILADPDRPISNLAIFTEAEKHQLLVEWNDTKREYPKDKCLHQLFEEQVEKSPDAVALVFDEKRLTYQELNRRANQLAHHLRSRGVGRETLVALCVERSIEMVVGLLAILKAGGAYVPMDPEYPRERLGFMLSDTQASVLLTQERLSQMLPEYSGQKVCLDQDWPEITRESEANLDNVVAADNLAYVIYTSGSTGKPKGVMIQHSSVVNFLTSMAREPGLTETDILLAVTTLSFDIAGLEIYLPLSLGARVVLARREVAVDGMRLAQQLSDCGATVMQATPATWHMLLASEWQGSRELKILCGGEALSEDLAGQLVHRCASLWNMYGPTETAIWSAVQRMPASVGRVALGRPIANTQLYILDGHLQPVPVGVNGELHIGGVGLARGYLNRPELTKEKFIGNPFSTDPTSRLYKTGDLARYLPDGNIEFLGRIDNQVKVHGYRIELGEIETVLGQHPAVREAVVLAREDSPGDRRLVAYVVAPPETSTNELRSFLKQKLPEFMVPSAFVCLDSLPLTPNGKVDRRALPAPDPSRTELDETFSLPRTPTEELLANIWAEVLKLEKIGIHDNFFELGGHSLLATQIVSRIRRIFQIDIPLRSLFENPTIATIAEKIEIATDAKKSAETIPIQRVLRKTNIPLSFAQERLWFLDQMDPGNPAFNMNGSFRLTGLLNPEALAQSLNEIVRRHDSLRTTFQLVDGVPVQVIAPSQTLKIQTIDLQSLPANERETQARQLAVEDSKRAFDLKEGPLFRAQLIRLSPRDHVLGIRMHHIVSDGWSLGVLYRELSGLYRAFCSGQPSPLAELSIQYADYAVWQREWFKGERLDAQLSYWKNQLSGAPSFLELPTDYPRPTIQTYHGGQASRVVSEDLYARLKALSSEEGVTLFMTLLAAFQLQLYRYTGQDDVVLGSPLAGRNRSEIEGLIGFFLNNLVLRTRLSGNPTFRELLGRVREVALGAYGHPDLPFEKLLKELRPERDLSRTPLFQVYLNMLTVDGFEPRLEGLTVDALRTSEPEAKFDLTLYIRENKNEFRFELVYNADLFRRSRSDEMLRQLENLLLQAVENPDQKIDSYCLLTRQSKMLLPDPTEKLDDEWKGAIHDRLAYHAKTHPRHLAVIDQSGQWSYAELNSHSNQLAHFLLAHGIASGNVVAIQGHRCASLVCAVLGVMKAGAMFLILDPAYPASRLIDCLQQANPRGWIDLEAAGPLGGELEDFVGTLSLRCRVELSAKIRTAGDPLNDYPTDNPGVPIGPDHLAYISFTSGSTGRPKGVLGRHGPLSHFLPQQEQDFRLSAADRFSMFSGLSHDPLQRDMFTPLWVGATICIPDPDIMGTSKLVPWMNEQKVTFAHLTPPMLQFLFMGRREPHCVPTLRYAFFVGDRLTARDLARLKHLAPNASSIGSYGTTETQRAVGCLVVANESDVERRADRPACPLGRGVGAVQLLVLNSERALAGIGELGEIYVRSPHLALGYLDDDALTQSRFLINPFTRMADDRIYKTGDLARYVPDGNIEFSGRIDNQVKIRGFRLELGEIESVLGQHSAVCEAVATVREDNSGDQQLVAYVVEHEGASVEAKELRGYLKEKLPDYMVPSAFVFMDALPLTPNGKLDRSGLPVPAAAPRTEFIAPRTPVEDNIAEIWAEVLRLDRVGISDNFFELGGHSLLAMQVVSRMRAVFNLDIPLRNLFEASTLADLAAMIIRQQMDEVGESEMERLLADVEAMSAEDAEQGYKDQLTKTNS